MEQKTKDVDWLYELDTVLSRAISEYINKYSKELLEAAEDCETSVEGFIKSGILDYASTFDILKAGVKK